MQKKVPIFRRGITNPKRISFDLSIKKIKIKFTADKKKIHIVQCTVINNHSTDQYQQTKGYEKQIV